MPRWALWVGLVVGLHAARAAADAGVRVGSAVIVGVVIFCLAWAVGLPLHEAASRRASMRSDRLRVGDYFSAAARGAVFLTVAVLRWSATTMAPFIGLLLAMWFFIWGYGQVSPVIYATAVAAAVLLLACAFALLLFRWRIRLWRRRRLVARLTPLLDGFASAWAGSAVSTDPVNRPAAETLVASVYREAGLPAPEIIWCPSPTAFIELTNAKADVATNIALGDNELPESERSEFLTLRIVTGVDPPAELWRTISSLAALWPGEQPSFPFSAGVGAIAAGANSSTLTELVAHTSNFHFGTQAAFLLERPLELHRDDAGALHSLNGPACRFPDQTSTWAIHGIIVDRDIVEAPETIDPLLALSHPNVAIRRILTERIGYPRIVAASHRQLIAEDDTGRLWHLPSREREQLALVEVENATVEADGSRKRYFLRVPPTCRTAREAVAWTFGLDPTEYAPQAQS